MGALSVTFRVNLQYETKIDGRSIRVVFSVLAGVFSQFRYENDVPVTDSAGFPSYRDYTSIFIYILFFFYSMEYQYRTDII